MIAENLKNVTLRISRCCEKSGRPVKDVRLVCVTKESDISQIEEAIGLGCKELGENRVQDAIIKYGSIGDKVTWHLIGHLQTNKVRDAVRIFSLIHSVDSLRLAAQISKEAKKIGKIQDILVQVNTSGEESKFGIDPAQLRHFLEEASLYPNINILGLMTMAPEVKDPNDARPCFRRLRELRDEVKAGRELSMGMTNDFEIAIEEGATMVRIGRAIFK